MNLKKKTYFFILLFLSTFLSSVICQTEENSTDDIFSNPDDCCNEGEDWISNDCSPPDKDNDRSEECLSSAKECCLKAKDKQAACERGIEVAKQGGNCDDVRKDENVAFCCNQCTLEMSLSLGNAGGCGEPGPSNKFYSCCMHALSKQEATTSIEEPTTTPTSEITTSKNQPTLNACELEGDELCAHKCVPTGSSYVCQCKSGYRLWQDKVSCRKMEVNRCLRNSPCQHLCQDTGDAIVCSCRSGYELMLDNVSCIDVDECAMDSHNCKAGQKCMNTIGSYECENIEKPDSSSVASRASSGQDKTNKAPGNCPSGFEANVLNQVCDDIDECKSNPCPHELQCVNTIGSFSCGFSSVPSPLPIVPPPVPPKSPYAPVDIDSDVICPPGFRISEELGNCKDIDECEESLDDCNKMSQVCLNTHGSFVCHNKASKTCTAGFMMNSEGKCEDTDECAENPDICTPDSVCVNEPGSYDCKSKSSIRPVPAGRPSSTPRSVYPTRAVQSSRPSQPSTGPKRPPPHSCPRGYRKASNGGCDDIDECAEGTHTCDDYQNCLNIMGGHRCVCKTGFQKDPITQACVDINECQRNELNDCSESQRCDNTIGSYHCIRYISCGTGYTLNSMTSRCEDDNECLLETHNCKQLGPMYDCLNLPGTYRCIRRQSPSTSTSTTTQGYDYDSSEYYTDTEEGNTKDDSQRSPVKPGRNDKTPPRQSKPSDPRQTHRYPDRLPSTSTSRPYEPPRRTDEPARRPEQTPVRPSEPSRAPYTPSRKPYEEPSRPVAEVTDVNDNYITTTPPPATRRFEYPPDQDRRPHERNTERSEYSTQPARTDDDYNREYPVPSVYYPKVQRPIYGNEPRFTTIPEPRDKTETLVGDRDVEGNIIVNTNDLKENTWTKLVPGSKRCMPGYAMDSNSECIDIDECKTGRNMCDQDSEVCYNTPGAYKCYCAPGYIKEREVDRCRKKEEIYSPSIPGNQPVWAPRPKKVCDIGFQVDPITNECVDTDECNDGTTRCATNEQCINTIGGFRCQCSPGFVLMSDRCVRPQQPIVPSRTRPVPVVRVTSPPRHNFCNWGYKFENNRCVDIDECATNKHSCQKNQHCVNIPGGYLCHCAPGHRVAQGGDCEDVDECTESGGKVCSKYATCINTVGSFECKCRQGFVTSPISKQLCNDVDECQENNGMGKCHQKCVNTWGSYRCACKAGYKLNPDNRTCSDIDECSALDRKLCIGTCQNIPGSYQCTCPKGYRMGIDKRSCIDIDECETGELVCGDEEVCQNTRGGARCNSIACSEGYVRDPASRHRCQRPAGTCSIHDYNCLHKPMTYSFNFITFVSRLYIPTGPRPQVDLFTMKGPNWPEAMLRFELRLKEVRVPPGVPAADMSYFKITDSAQQAVVSLVRPIIGPQDIDLELHMDLFRLGNFEGTVFAKILIFVSEYDF